MRNELERAIDLQRRGDARAAAEIYRAILRNDPRNAEALHFMGLAFRQLGDARSAEEFFGRALAVDPDQANTLCDLATLCAEQKRYEEALPHFRRALQLNPNHTDALTNLANVFRKLNRPQDALPLHERFTRIQPRDAAGFRRLADTHYRLGDVAGAIAGYRRAIDLAPDDRLARVNLGDAYESAGQFKQAKFHYSAALRRDANSPLALARLLQLRDQTVEPRWVDHARAMVLAPRTQLDARIRLNVALGHYYDRQRDYDVAFGFLRKGNELQFAKDPYDSSHFTDAVDRLMEAFTRETFAAASATARREGAERPVFIVGMPRSGTTLAEQILASHSQVAGGGELSTIMNLGMQVQELSSTKRPYPHGVADLGEAGLARLASRYLERLDKISATARHVTDKLPFNFMHLGLIALLFPGAKVIHCRRDPIDNALSCYFTSFADQIQFANDLGTLGRYYVDYARLMDHWRAILPLRILDVQYESLVGDTERVVREMVEYCGLEWEEQCLQFHRTARGVTTPSRWQVRQPIYSGSVARWRHYEGHLGGLREALGPVLGD